MNSHVPASELAPEDAWHRSSYSNAGGNCVEIADATATHGVIGVRDSKNPNGPALRFRPAGWVSFVGLVRTGEVRSTTA
ncbi:DUF397 domain-containing protein [Streptomyces sp. NPDC091292]|uniref:DUF397 domain-containing protein n=1 Tax=Streptomyces sp. NPDC091292 TaxID=3365991 RepID=UPI003800DA68